MGTQREMVRNPGAQSQSVKTGSWKSRNSLGREGEGYRTHIWQHGSLEKHSVGWIERGLQEKGRQGKSLGPCA